MTTQTPATAEIEKWLRIRARFSQIFNFGSERKTQNPAGVDSGTPDPVPTLVKTKIDQIIKCSCTVNIRHILRKNELNVCSFPSEDWGKYLYLLRCVKKLKILWTEKWKNLTQVKWLGFCKRKSRMWILPLMHGIFRRSTVTVDCKVGFKHSRMFSFSISKNEYFQWHCNRVRFDCHIAGVPNFSVIMYPFSISTDEHVPRKFLMTKYFIITNHSYI